jgi:D-alanine-D-alanine ligase-like ATP-grasp enzyme
MRYPFASLLIQELGPTMGIAVELEPEYGFAGELVFPDGRRHMFRNTNFNVNPAGSTEIAKDKAYTNYFLRKHGYRVPEGKTFFSERLNLNIPEAKRRGIDEAVKYATQLGFPVFAKPNNLSQGAFVTKVHTTQELTSVANAIFERTDVMLVEVPCSGADYRVVVLGSEVISAYKRVPLRVIGNGKSTIAGLLEDAQAALADQGRPNSEIDLSDCRIDIKLRSLSQNRSWIPLVNETVQLLDNANLSTGGTSFDVTENVHPAFAQIAIAATKTLGLTLCGVDILTDDIQQPPDSQVWTIIELNAAPGLDNYSSLGDAQAERVKSLYRKILLHLAAH